MNWQKANQALGNIERLLQVFETSDKLSSIERDLLLKRIQDLYEIVLENEDTSNNKQPSVRVVEKPVVTPPPVNERPKVEEEIELPKVEVPPIQKPVVETPKPKVEVPKVEEKPPVIERVEQPKPPAVERPKVEQSKPPIVEQPTYQEPAVTTNFDEEEAEIIEELFEFKTATDLSEKLSAGPIRDLTTSMSINERFITISELFKGNKAKYDEAIHDLNNFNNFEQAKAYMLNHLIREFDWTNKKKTKLVKAFIKKVRRRYL